MDCISSRPKNVKSKISRNPNVNKGTKHPHPQSKTVKANWKNSVSSKFTLTVFLADVGPIVQKILRQFEYRPPSEVPSFTLFLVSNQQPND